MVELIVPPLVGLVVGALFFSALEARWSAGPARWWRRGGHAVDLAYWFMQPLAAFVGERLVLILVVVPLSLALGAPRLEDVGRFVEGRHTAVAGLPAPIQAALVLALGDLSGYWLHRALHWPPLWRFHVVHHATRKLDWLSAARNHPLGDILPKLLQVAPMFLLGFRLDVLSGVAPLFALHALLIHANVRWTFGPLRYVIASPAFHRWHHALDAEARDKNFAGMFPVWDLLFGTFHLPVGRQPVAFGVEEAVPSGFFAQLWLPFRRCTFRPSAVVVGTGKGAG